MRNHVKIKFILFMTTLTSLITAQIPLPDNYVFIDRVITDTAENTLHKNILSALLDTKPRYYNSLQKNDYIVIRMSDNGGMEFATIYGLKKLAEKYNHIFFLIHFIPDDLVEKNEKGNRIEIYFYHNNQCYLTDILLKSKLDSKANSYFHDKLESLYYPSSLLSIIEESEHYIESFEKVAKKIEADLQLVYKSNNKNQFCHEWEKAQNKNYWFKNIKIS